MVVLNFTTGSEPLGLTQYLLNQNKQKDSTQAIVATNMGGRDPYELAEEFRFIHDLRPKVKHFMRHFSISFAPGEQVGAEQFRATVKRLLELTGHQRCPYFAVRHHDQEHKHGVSHGHVAVCAIRTDGERVSDSNILRRLKQEDRSLGRSIERQLELDVGLVAVEVRPEAEQRNLTTGEYRLKERTGATLPKEKLWHAIDGATADQPPMPILVARLKTAGVEVQFSEFDEGSKGLSFAIDGKRFQGRRLAKAYSFGGLQQHRGVSYEADRDDEQLRQLNAMSGDECQSWLEQQEQRRLQPSRETNPAIAQPELLVALAPTISTSQPIEQIQREQADYANRLTPIMVEIWQRERSGRTNLTTATFEPYRIEAQGDQPPELFKHDQRLLHWTGDGYQGEGLSLQDCEAIEQFNQFSIRQALDRDQVQAAAVAQAHDQERQRQLEHQAWVAAQMQVAIDYFHYQRQANRLRQTPTGQPLANWGDLQIVQRHDQAGEYFALRSIERGDLVRQRSGQAAIETSAGLTATDAEAIARLQRQLAVRNTLQPDPVQVTIANPQWEQEQQQETYQARYQRYAEQKTDKILSFEQRDLLVGWKALQAGESRETVEAILIAGSEQAKLVRKQQGDQAGHDYIQQQIAQIMAERDRQATHHQQGVEEKPNVDRGR